MKTLTGFFILMCLFIFSSCNDRNDIQREEITDKNIQREEAMRADDIRETDSYDNTVPLDTDDEVEAVEEE